MSADKEVTQDLWEQQTAIRHEVPTDSEERPWNEVLGLETATPLPNPPETESAIPEIDREDQASDVSGTFVQVESPVDLVGAADERPADNVAEKLSTPPPPPPPPPPPASDGEPIVTAQEATDTVDAENGDDDDDAEDHKKPNQNILAHNPRKVFGKGTRGKAEGDLPSQVQKDKGGATAASVDKPSTPNDSQQEEEQGNSIPPLAQYPSPLAIRRVGETTANFAPLTFGTMSPKARRNQTHVTSESPNGHTKFGRTVPKHPGSSDATVSNPLASAFEADIGSHPPRLAQHGSNGLPSPSATMFKSDATRPRNSSAETAGGLHNGLLNAVFGLNSATTEPNTSLKQADSYVASTSLRAPRIVDICGYGAAGERANNGQARNDDLRIFTRADYEQWRQKQPGGDDEKFSNQQIDNTRVIDISGFGSVHNKVAPTKKDEAKELALESDSYLIARHYYAQVRAFYKWLFLESGLEYHDPGSPNNEQSFTAKVKSIPQILSHYGLLGQRLMQDCDTYALFSGVPEYDYTTQMRILKLVPNSNDKSHIATGGNAATIPAVYASPLANRATNTRSVAYHLQLQHQHPLESKIADRTIVSSADVLFAALRGKYGAHSFPFIHFGSTK